MAKLNYVAETGVWTVRGDGAIVAYPITPVQAVSIDDVQFLEIVAESEQLDELSRRTLVDYTQKAVINKSDADRRAVLARVSGDDAEHAKQDRRSQKRFDGILKATSKLRREEVEAILENLPKEIQEGQGGIIDQLRAASQIKTTAPIRFADGHSTTVPLPVAQHAVNKYEMKKDPQGKRSLAMKMNKSLNGFKAAIKEEAEMEVTKEQFEAVIAKVNAGEQLDELDKKTLGSYIKKAKSQAITGPTIARIRLGRDDVEGYKRLVNRTNRRSRGIDRAADKLTKEETEQLEEGLRLKATYTSKDGRKVAKVYKDHEWDEHRVKFYTDGKHHTDADSHGDEEDAHDTAKHWTGNLKENAIVEKTKFDDDEDERAEAAANKKAKKAGDLMKRWRSKEKRQFEAEELNESKFKVGDRVKHEERTKMAPHFAGKTGTITGVNANGSESHVDVKWDHDPEDKRGNHPIHVNFLSKHMKEDFTGPRHYERALEEKAKFDDDDGSEVADKLASKELKKAYVRMKRSRATEKRKFEEVIYKPNVSDSVAIVAEDAFVGSFAEALKGIVSQKRSIDEEARVKDFLSRLDEDSAHHFHNYLTKGCGMVKVGETHSHRSTTHHYAHPDSEHEDHTGYGDEVDVHVKKSNGQTYAVSRADHYTHMHSPQGNRHDTVESLHKERQNG